VSRNRGFLIWCKGSIYALTLKASKAFFDGILNVFYLLNIKDLEGGTKVKLFIPVKLFFLLFSFFGLGLLKNI